MAGAIRVTDLLRMTEITSGSSVNVKMIGLLMAGIIMFQKIFLKHILSD